MSEQALQRGGHIGGEQGTDQPGQKSRAVDPRRAPVGPCLPGVEPFERGDQCRGEVSAGVSLVGPDALFARLGATEATQPVQEPRVPLQRLGIGRLEERDEVCAQREPSPAIDDPRHARARLELRVPREHVAEVRPDQPGVSSRFSSRLGS